MIFHFCIFKNVYTRVNTKFTTKTDGVLMNNRVKRDTLLMQKEQEKLSRILEKNPNYESEMNTKIESIIDTAIENTPNRNEDKILAKTERKLKKLGLRLSREKLRVMIVNQIEDARMLEEARKEEEEEAQAEKY